MATQDPSAEIASLIDKISGFKDIASQVRVFLSVDTIPMALLVSTEIPYSVATTSDWNTNSALVNRSTTTKVPAPRYLMLRGS